MPLTPTTTAPELFVSLSVIGAQLMIETLAGLEADTITPQEQDETLSTLAPILTRDDARIDFTRTAREIDCRFRGFQPWPGAFTTLRGKKLIVHAMHVAAEGESYTPGTLMLRGVQMLVACGAFSVVVLDEVQLEGKKRMPASEFLRGFQVKEGEVLGEANPL